MRLDYIKNASIASAGNKAPGLMIEMEYLPECSKNSYKLRDGTIKRQVREWMGCLTFIVRALTNSANLEFKLPVTVRIDGVFENRVKMPDLHNMIIVVADSIEEALGINDQQFKIETGIPQVGDDVKLVITIRGSNDVRTTGKRL